MTKKTFDELTFDEFCEVAAKEGITDRARLWPIFRDRPLPRPSPAYDEARLRETFRKFKEDLT